MTGETCTAFRTHVDGLPCPGSGRRFRARTGPTFRKLRITRTMNKHSRRLPAAVTAAASAAVLSTLLAVPAHAAPTDRAAASVEALSLVASSPGASLSAGFVAQLAAPTKATSAPARTYTVKAGDSLSGIARKTGVPLQTLFALNKLGWTSTIYPGQKIILAKSAASAPKPAVKAPAPKKGTTTISVTVGPKKPAPAPKPSTPKPAATKTYTVRSGDSLWKISTRTGVPLKTLYALNRLTSSSIIYPGQVIKLNGKAAAPAPAKSAPAPSTSGTESVAQIKSIISSTAAAMGVDRSLALAIGEQESSFRQNVTSHAGAIGTMQVMPTSGIWASELVGRQLNLRNTKDNITAGVAIIRQLVRTSPNLNIAIASYYQGQYSVMNRGMYEDTKTYVSQVKNRINKFR